MEDNNSRDFISNDLNDTLRYVAEVKAKNKLFSFFVLARQRKKEVSTSLSLGQ